MVMALNTPLPSQTRDSKKPKKHQAAKAVNRAKSDIIDLRDRNRRLSESKLNAKRGISTGAPIARTSKACCPGSRDPVFQPYIRRMRKIQYMTAKVTSRNDQRFCVYTCLKYSQSVPCQAKHASPKGGYMSSKHRYLVNLPSMLHNGSKLIKDPAKGIDGKAQLQVGHPGRIPLGHKGDVKSQQDDKLNDLQDVSRPWNDQAILVKKRRFPWIINRNRLQFVSVRYEV